jgi:hypothetical protein
VTSTFKSSSAELSSIFVSSTVGSKLIDEVSGSGSLIDSIVGS